MKRCLKLFGVLLAITLLLALTGCGVENVQYTVVDLSDVRYYDVDKWDAEGNYTFLRYARELSLCDEADSVWIGENGYKVTFEKDGETYTQYSFPFGYIHAPDVVHGSNDEWYVSFFICTMTLGENGFYVEDMPCMVQYKNLDVSMAIEYSEIINVYIDGRMNGNSNEDGSVEFTMNSIGADWWGADEVEYVLNNIAAENQDTVFSGGTLFVPGTAAVNIHTDRDYLLYEHGYTDISPDRTDLLEPSHFLRVKFESCLISEPDAGVTYTGEGAIRFSYDVVFDGGDVIAENESTTLVHEFAITDSGVYEEDFPN